MIDPTLFLAFAAAVTVLMLIPGLNVAVIHVSQMTIGFTLYELPE